MILRFIVLLFLGISTDFFAYGNSGNNDADTTKKSRDKIVTVAYTVDTSKKVVDIKVLKVKM